MKQPMQPLVTEEGVVRFQQNSLVVYLLDNGGLSMNDLARIQASAEDRMQFAQLIGYSHSGYGELGYVTDESFNTAAHMLNEGLTEDKARIKALEGELASLRAAINGLREPAARLFEMHPDDLKA